MQSAAAAARMKAEAGNPQIDLYQFSGGQEAIAKEQGLSQKLTSVSRLAEIPQGLKDQEADTLTGIVVPAGTPKAVVDRLQSEIAKIVATPEVRGKLTAIGFNPIANTPSEFAARIRSEMEKWGKVVRAAKLRVE